eukprot:TRINITY_DN82480_c0_g1_i1.p1 TRINITY_DN82480_c0_g1~~TRINITY_DN82480_c0_g1_i1.p1  ORF type:complete len:398 (-),score=66.53 TRINITY_DN82480_c0_g1_i1:167-1360(-)
MTAAWVVAAVLLSCLAPCSSLSLEQRHVKRQPSSILGAGNNMTSEGAAPAAQLPAFMLKMASECQCSFRDTCSCKASAAFMQCIRDACSAKKCDCEGHHFENACQDMDATCPVVGLSCSKGTARCTDANKVRIVQRAAAQTMRQLPVSTTAAAVATAHTTQVPAPAPAVKIAAAPAAEHAKMAPAPAPPTTVVATKAPAPAPLTAPAAGGGEAPSVQSVTEPKMSITDVLMQSFSYILLVCAVAYFYHQRKKDIPPQSLPYDGDEFTHSICNLMDSHEGGHICLCAWCCPAIRWAETASNVKVNLLSFWQALLIFLLLSVYAAGMHSAGYIELGSVFWIMLVIVAVWQRQKLRGVFGHGQGRLKTVALDTLTWICCPCCAIIQEAKEVEYVSVKSFR